VFWSDNGGEYISKGFERFLRAHGIEKQTSTPYRPQPNGVAERANRTLVKMARSMLHAQNFKKSLWAEAVVNAAYTRNRCPSRALPSITPEEGWSGRKPCISHMRVFGFIAYAMVPEEKRGKLDAKGSKCLFLGYCEGTKAYRLMCVQSKKIIKCRDVEFMEDSTSVSNDLEMHPSGRNETPNVVIVDTSSKSPCVDDDEGTSDVKEYPSNQEVLPTLGCSSTPSTPSKDASTNGEQEGQALEERRYPLRERRPLGKWWKNHILPQQDVERANVACLDDPLNLCDAMHSEDASKWEVAMQEEYGSLMANGTWESVPLPKDCKGVGCKWVFRTKRDASGHIVRHKARLVAKGYSQVEGVDFNERCSTTWYVFFVGVGAVSWNCKRQPTSALSTTEAEYMATSQCTKEAIWLRKLMANVGLVQVGATTIMCDNKGCIALAKNPTHHSRTKHIDIQHHFIREKLESGEIGVKYYPTQDMVADVLTKGISKGVASKPYKKHGIGSLRLFAKWEC